MIYIIAFPLSEHLLVHMHASQNSHKQQTSHVYKTTHKPIWIYGIRLWGTASTSNIEILEHFQLKALRMTVDIHWYMPDMVI
jgi:hypothetical protein